MLKLLNGSKQIKNISFSAKNAYDNVFILICLFVKRWRVILTTRKQQRISFSLHGVCVNQIFPSCKL